ncbi:hypothetical protein Tco_0943388 [Tanacetum coccineum]
MMCLILEIRCLRSINGGKSVVESGGSMLLSGGLKGCLDHLILRSSPLLPPLQSGLEIVRVSATLEEYLQHLPGFASNERELLATIEELKEAMMQAPVLVLLDFNQTFTLETDAFVTSDLLQQIQNSFATDVDI